MIHFICIRCPRGTDTTMRLQPKQNASAVRGHTTLNGRFSGVGCESKISIGACVILSCRHASVVLFSLSADRLSCLFEWDWGLLLGINDCNLKLFSQCTFQVGTLVYTLYCTEKIFFFILIQINFNKKKKGTKNQCHIFYLLFQWSQFVACLVLAD